ncbi:CD164 sialomucin-like 2 protein isoform X2 [Oreochromis niloticus]|uniref:CD164 sialomucin-like 2 protein isoform X2 n=1 Tax=Oreochromis niloticus TaxID=8128 RepID=UPI000DF289D6|nr:CD164 sialomucin-like 2 protein isoform X2 [Oreochromis niloticus]
MHFRWLEVGQLVAREPSLVALMLHRSPHSYLSLCPGYHHLQKPFRGQAEETSIQSLFLVFKINSLLSANVSRCRSQVSVAVRMQLVAFTVLSSTLLLLAVIPSVYLQPDCSQAESCDLCVGDSMLNLTGCVWRLCPNGNDTGMCVTDEGDSADNGMNCSWTRVSELCTVVESVAAGGGETVSGDDSNTNSSPEFSQAKFDMSSFIGGIILVLCLQAGGFFAMRFLKSKEQSNYDPM